MAKKMSYQLVPTILPDNGKERTIVWTSSDDTVATVDANGKITALKTGVATIKAYLPDSGVYAECVVKVVQNKYEEICLSEE